MIRRTSEAIREDCELYGACIQLAETAFVSSSGQKLWIKFSIEFVVDLTVALAIECHCLAIPVLKTVMSEKTVSVVECDSCSYFRALQMFLIDVRMPIAPVNIIVTVYYPIEVIMNLITEPGVAQVAR